MKNEKNKLAFMIKGWKGLASFGPNPTDTKEELLYQFLANLDLERINIGLHLQIGISSLLLNE